ncbi:MAG: hypothetical protein JXA03_12005 [Bacteroidales bacterium]|nr:hypothetical protein [Bacteroidales bacterium]
MKTKYTLFLTAMICFGSLTEFVKAIPAFARKYQMSCITCHSPMPRLKAYGEDFAGNGFRLSDQESSRFFMDTGDEELSLIRDFPLAVRMDAHLKFNHANERSTDFGSPYILKLMSGGDLSKKLAYYFYVYFDERGEVVGVEDAYLFYNQMFGTELDLAVGQFSVSDPLFKRELRLTLEDYYIYNLRPGISHARLSYDRGIMLTQGFSTGTDLAFEVVNGNGLADADASKIFDNDDHKNFAGRISQSIGDFLRIGLFGYYGKEALKYNDGGGFTNELYYWGPDLTLALGDMVELNLQYMYRNDSEMLPNLSSVTLFENVETQGGFAELIFTPRGDKSKWYMVGLVNWTDSGFDEGDYAASTLHLGYLLRRNIRLVSEFTYDYTLSNRTYGKGSVGFIAAF